jgi:hypothetical protein
MDKQTTRMVVGACLVSAALAWWLATSPTSPIQPRPQRPFLSAIARIAKAALWVMLVADKPPEGDRHEHYALHSVDADGHRVLDHARGW